jgi:cytochrome b involved in lipid metabolism
MGRTLLAVFLLVLSVGLVLFIRDYQFTTDNTQKEMKAAPCIITVNDKQYDVSILKQDHMGGDIFECGTNMTEQFTSKHGLDYIRLEPYLISP